MSKNNEETSTLKPEQLYLTYLVFKDNQKMLGHSAVGISKKLADGSHQLIFRVGLFPSDQVLVEDFILDKTGREFYCKQFPITEDEMTLVLHKINEDRREITASKKNVENKNAPLPKQSTPGGKEYHKYMNNCKDYALSLLAAARQSIHNLKNSGVSLPRFSGKLDRVCLQKTETGRFIIHNSGTKGFYLEKAHQYLNDRNKNPATHFSVLGFLRPSISREIKISATQKLLEILNGSLNVNFSQEEYKALKQGRLGSIVKGLKASKILDINTLKPNSLEHTKRFAFINAAKNTVMLLREKLKSSQNKKPENDDEISFRKK